MEYSRKNDFNQVTLYQNGMYIQCDVCNISLKVRTSRTFIISRWNEHLLAKVHQAKHEYKTHITTMKLKAAKDVVLSKGDSTDLRKKIGIQSFFSPKKNMMKLLMKNTFFYKIQLSLMHVQILFPVLKE